MSAATQLPTRPPVYPYPRPPALPLAALHCGLRRFTVDEYHKMIEVGILQEGEPCELLFGVVVNKMPRNPPHDNRLVAVMMMLLRHLPPGWVVRPQTAVVLGDSEPEPDLAVAAGDLTTYETRHPQPADLALVVEIANTSLASDRADKGTAYAGAGIPMYWIVNVIDRQVEVHTGPTAGGYAQRDIFRAGDEVPLPARLGNGTVPAADLLP